VLEDVTVLTGNRVGVAVSLALSALCVLAFSYVAARYGLPRGKDGGAFVRVMLYGVLGGGAGAWWFSRVSRKPTKRARELRVTDDGVHADGKRLLARDEIRSARVYPGRVEGAFVRLTRRNV